MEYTVWFDLSEISKISYFTATGVFSGLFLIALSLFVGSLNKTTHMIYWHVILSALFAVVFLYFAVTTFLGTFHMVKSIYEGYERKETFVVEGEVENCNTSHFYKEGRGSFEVDGVQFDYGHAVGIPGYRGRKNLIYENGQQLKIHYIVYSGQNIIVRIEGIVD